MGFDREEELLGWLGLEVDRPQQGCCGMAGSFGMERETHDIGRAIGEREILPAVRDADPDVTMLANGFSCREQIRQATNRQTVHLAELLAERMIGSRSSQVSDHAGQIAK